MAKTILAAFLLALLAACGGGDGDGDGGDPPPPPQRAFNLSGSVTTVGGANSFPVNTLEYTNTTAVTQQVRVEHSIAYLTLTNSGGATGSGKVIGAVTIAADAPIIVESSAETAMGRSAAWVSTQQYSVGAGQTIRCEGIIYAASSGVAGSVSYNWVNWTMTLTPAVR